MRCIKVTYAIYFPGTHLTLALRGKKVMGGQGSGETVSDGMDKGECFSLFCIVTQFPVSLGSKKHTASQMDEDKDDQPSPRKKVVFQLPPLNPNCDKHTVYGDDGSHDNSGGREGEGNHPPINILVDTCNSTPEVDELEPSEVDVDYIPVCTGNNQLDIVPNSSLEQLDEDQESDRYKDESSKSMHIDKGKGVARGSPKQPPRLAMHSDSDEVCAFCISFLY